MRWSRPLLTIFFSTLVISGIPWASWWGYGEWMAKKGRDPRYDVRAVMTKSLSGSEPLKPAVIAEWLNLSVSNKKNLYQLDLTQAQKMIERQAPVKKALLTRVPPSTLLVEVEMRRPIAMIGDRTNMAVDEEGKTFPLDPFYTPKKLPRLFIGEKKNFLLALEILKHLQALSKMDKVDFIDVEKSSASSMGEREVVLMYEGIWVRLDPDRIADGLNKLLKLRATPAKIVDLRIANLALIVP